MNSNRFSYYKLYNPYVIIDIVKKDDKWKIDIVEPNRIYNQESTDLWEKYGGDVNGGKAKYVRKGLIENYSIEERTSFFIRNPKMSRVLGLSIKIPKINENWEEIKQIVNRYN